MATFDDNGFPAVMVVMVPAFVAMPTAIMMVVMPPVHSVVPLDDDFLGTGQCRGS
jgi:hypothetical protein